MPGEARPGVCVVGSANLDLIVDLDRIPAPGETVAGSGQSSGPGGKGLNQAVAAARAGAAVSFVGSVGSDEAGARLRATLAEAGVDVSGLRTVTAATGSAVVLRAADGENAIVVSAGANGVGFAVDVDLAQRIAGSAVVLCQQEIPAAMNAAVIAAARAGGPSGDPRAGGAGAGGVPLVVVNAAPADRLDPSVLAAIDLLIVNEHELAAQLDPSTPAIDGADPAAVAAAAASLVTVARAVVVTLGGAGAVCVETNPPGVGPGNGSAAGSRAARAMHVPAVAVARVVDTTGAGDAFCGALCAALSRGTGLVEAVRYGAAAGALAVGGYGAAPAMPSAARIREALETSPPPRPLSLP